MIHTIQGTKIFSFLGSILKSWFWHKLHKFYLELHQFWCNLCKKSFIGLTPGRDQACFQLNILLKKKVLLRHKKNGNVTDPSGDWNKRFFVCLPRWHWSESIYCDAHGQVEKVKRWQACKKKIKLDLFEVTNHQKCSYTHVTDVYDPHLV